MLKAPDPETVPLDLDLDTALRHCWHPVCSLDELRAAAPHPLPVRLLDVALAVCDLGPPGAPAVVALPDRCPHRSTRLSVGWVEDGSLRCANHGWCFDRSGRCTDIPSLAGGPVPERAHLTGFDVELAYGLVWVRLSSGASTSVPAHPSWGSPEFKVLVGAPYTWPTSAARRVENFVDIAHFPWVHDGTLGRRDEPVPPLPDVRREAGELRFEFVPPTIDAADVALFGWSAYRMPIPLTVDIEFRLASGATRWLWMTASPIDARTCRTFWTVARDDDLDGDDAAHMAFQELILREDEPVVCNQDPPELPLDATEVSVRTDRVSIEYRRWLRELAVAGASTNPAAAVGAVLSSEEEKAMVES
jgi:vanillate O-demethylase monooxygenase subunit